MRRGISRAKEKIKKSKKISKKGLTKRKERGIIIELSARAGSEVIEN